MQDVQNSPAKLALPIDRVGVKNLEIPFIVRDKQQGQQHTVAKLDLSVDLPAKFKGTHMSRFLEAIGEQPFVLDYWAYKDFLQDLQQRLQARRAHATFSFPYFMHQKSPVSGISALMSYSCFLQGEIVDSNLDMTLGVTVPVMTVCPCSLAISENGAHSQRALVKMQVKFSGLLWLEDLIHIGQNAGSSPVYALLKRVDEKYVTESAFAHPTFVEDVVRGAAHALDNHPQINSYEVEVESFESIHNHSAYACIKNTL